MMKSRPLDILIIEDCQEDIELATDVLSSGNFINRLNVIYNGKDALSYLKKKDVSKGFVPPDLIILDLNIPKINGFEVLSEISNDQELNNIPLIIFTTSDITPETLKEDKFDFRQYVKKSIDFHELVEVIKSMEERDETSKPVLPASGSSMDDDKINILLIEDNIEDAELIEELLFMKEKDRWSLKHCERLDEALECLKHNDFDVVILDLFLPDARGLETLKKFVTCNHNVPTIVMTSLKDKHIGKEAIREGAQDYLIKGQITSDYFIRAVEHAIERKKLEKLRDDLLSYVNHELSNPLAVIKDSIAQIAEGAVGGINDQQKHFLDTSLSNINRLIMITDDLLLCTMLELGKLPINKGSFNFSELVKEVVETYRVSFVNKGLALKCLLPEQDAVVHADRGRISQVLANLLNNALKFTSKGTVQIAVERCDCGIVCSVKDTGPGIAQEEIPKLFKKYQKGYLQNRNGIKGTGLGLFICKTLVELHGGQIQIKSLAGEGTEAMLILPVS